MEEAYLDVARRHTEPCRQGPRAGLAETTRKIEKTAIGSSLRIWIPDIEKERRNRPTIIPTTLPTNQKFSTPKSLKNNTIKFWMERFARSRRTQKNNGLSACLARRPSACARQISTM
jgi:hypothetical protein